MKLTAITTCTQVGKVNVISLGVHDYEYHVNANWLFEIVVKGFI